MVVLQHGVTLTLQFGLDDELGLVERKAFVVNEAASEAETSCPSQTHMRQTTDNRRSIDLSLTRCEPLMQALQLALDALFLSHQRVKFDTRCACTHCKNSQLKTNMKTQSQFLLFGFFLVVEVFFFFLQAQNTCQSAKSIATQTSLLQWLMMRACTAARSTTPCRTMLRRASSLQMKRPEKKKNKGEKVSCVPPKMSVFAQVVQTVDDLKGSATDMVTESSRHAHNHKKDDDNLAETWVDPRDVTIGRWKQASIVYDATVMFVLPLLNVLTDFLTAAVFAVSFNQSACFDAESGIVGNINSRNDGQAIVVAVGLSSAAAVLGLIAFVWVLILARRRWSKVGTVWSKMQVCLEELAHDGATSQLCTPSGEWHVMHALQLFQLIFEDLCAIVSAYAFVRVFPPVTVQTVSVALSMLAFAKSLALWLSLAFCCSCRRYDRCRCCVDKNAVRVRYGFCLLLFATAFVILFWSYIGLTEDRPLGTTVVGIDVSVVDVRLDGVAGPARLLSSWTAEDGAGDNVLDKGRRPLFLLSMASDSVNGSSITTYYDDHNFTEYGVQLHSTMQTSGVSHALAFTYHGCCALRFASYALSTNCANELDAEDFTEDSFLPMNEPIYEPPLGLRDDIFPACAYKEIADGGCSDLTVSVLLDGNSSGLFKHQLCNDGRCGIAHPLCPYLRPNSKAMMQVRVRFGDRIVDC